MKNVYVVVPDKACEFGAPLAVFSTRELADSYVAKKQRKQFETDGFVHRGYFIFTFTIDDESGSVGEPTLVKKDGQISSSK